MMKITSLILGLQVLVSTTYLAKLLENWTTLELSCRGQQILKLGEIVTDNTIVTFADCPVYNLTILINITAINGLYIKGDKGLTIRCKKDHSGLSFKNVTNLHLEHLHLQFCGSSNVEAMHHISSINITNSMNVVISNILVESSRGTALALENTGGRVSIQDCTFQGNGNQQYSRRSEASFVTDYLYNDDAPSKRGGGLQVIIGGELNDSSYEIKSCKFLSNLASSAGGLFLVVQDHAKRNQISVDNCTFRHNKCKYGGGGVQVGYIRNEHQLEYSPTENTIKFTDCLFKKNQAENGGGTSIMANQGALTFAHNKLTFTKCTWLNNSAILGLAMDVYATQDQREIFPKERLWPLLVLAGCRLLKNRAYGFQNAGLIVNNPRSALVVSGFKIQFKGHLNFEKNAGSAIEATSTILDFQANSTVKFVGNIGITGGALQLRESTVINIRDNSYFLFENNTADKSGGAIFVETNDKHHFFSPNSGCFIQYQGDSDKPDNVSLVFVNNKADFIFRQINKTKPVPENYQYRGDSLYITTLIPCLRQCVQAGSSQRPIPLEKTFQCLGNVSIDKTSRQFSTAASHFVRSNFEHNNTGCLYTFNHTHILPVLNNNSNPIIGSQCLHIHVVPGKNESLPFKLVDELCGEVIFDVEVRVISPKYTSLFIDPAHRTITDNYITLYGVPGDSGKIHLSTMGARDITLAISVKIDDCPPGYIYDPKLKKCSCSVNRNAYAGIERCDEVTFRAYIKPGFWVGYVNISDRLRTKQNRLASAVCPLGFCKMSPSKGGLHSSKDLSQDVCNSNREGIICGVCKMNRSVYYHSESFSCSRNDLCHWGVAFYILSELLPVTIIFLVVIFFNISFTSGALNGVILFVQVTSTLKIRAENFIQFEETTLWWVKIIQTLYGSFSLNTFAIEELSFCLWSGANALDMLAFKYVTMVYSLLLVIGTVLFLKVCTFQRVSGKKVPSLKRSTIHGLSAFIVMNYSECAKISLSVFNRGILTVGPSNDTLIRQVVFYNGELSYMGPEHLKYVLPAIFFTVTMVLIPPLLLLSYPLCYKLFALLGIEETKFAQIMCKIFPLEKIKPLFDSTQGAFKDHYRFFSGMYFVYRFLALLTYSFAYSLTAFYVFMEIQLICILFLHAVCSPYKETRHNILDTILFSNLAIVNAITLLNYYENSSTQLVARITIQCILLSIPLVYLISYTMYYMIKASCVCKSSTVKSYKDNDNSDNEVLNILDRRIQGNNYSPID